jgi:FMN reductase
MADVASCLDLHEAPMSFSPFIVGIGGTARPSSTSERAVAEALRWARALGARTKLFNGEFVSRLPLYVPGCSDRNPEEREFIDDVRLCQGIIVGTPGYHGSLSGSIKNALDLLEDTARDVRPYLDGRAFGSVVTACGWQACGTTLVSLRLVAHALRAWPTPFGATLNASTPLFDTDGACIDVQNSKQLSIVASQVVEFARWHEAGLGSHSDSFAEMEVQT